MEYLGSLGRAGRYRSSSPLHRLCILVRLPFPSTPSSLLTSFPDATTTAAVAAWALPQCTAPAGCPPRNTTTMATIEEHHQRRRIVRNRWEIKPRERRLIRMMGIMAGMVMGLTTIMGSLTIVCTTIGGLSCSRRKTCTQRRRGRFMRHRWDLRERVMGLFGRGEQRRRE
jgi:hypothetical protein